jgi:hypothetical protein
MSACVDPQFITIKIYTADAYLIRYDIFNCNWVDTWWQQYTFTHKQHIIDTKQYIEQHNSLIRKNAKEYGGVILLYEY